MAVETSPTGLAYRRRGRGTPVLLVYGIPGAGRAWAGVGAHLPENVNAVVPDLIGFASSDRPRALTMDALGAEVQVTALAGLLDELGMARAVVCGHDFGVPVTALLAARRPDLVFAVLLMAGNAFPDTPIQFPLSLTTALTRLTDIYAAVEAALRQLDVPVVVAWGDRDPFFAIDLGRRTAATAIGRFHVLEGAGHFLPHERPAEVARQIENLVAGAPS